MAVRVFLKNSTTHPRATRVIPGSFYRDADRTRGASAVTLGQSTTAGAVRMMADTAHVTSPFEFWSERVAAPYTLSGDIVFNIRGNTTSQTLARFRVTITKISANGSDVETMLGTADATADITSTETAFTLTVTVSTPIVIAAGERFLVRIYVFRTDGGTSFVTIRVFYNGPTAGASGDSWFDLPGTPTFRTNPTTFSLRRTTGTGIGAFMDALDTFGVSAFTTAITNTSAGATEITMTKTAGGAVAEWITPRLKGQWELPSDTTTGKLMMQTMTGAAQESAAAANAAFLLRIFARSPTGVETQIFEVFPNSSVELTTTMTNWTKAGANVFAFTDQIGEDWRLVIRGYIQPASGLTMGGGSTVTLGYDGPAATTGTTQFALLDLPELKLETDPAKSPTVPSGGSGAMLGGLSNGQ